MKINTTTVLTGCGALISLGLVPIFINYATSQPPQWTKDNPGLVWLIAVILIVLAISLGSISATNAEGLQKSDPSDIGPAMQEANDIIEETTNYSEPNFAMPPNLGAILDRSKTVADAFGKTYYRERKKRDREAKYMQNQCIAALLKLLIATAKYFALQGKQNDLIEMASQAYNISKVRGEWADAAKMAYQVAKAHYELLHIRECRMWTYKLEKCVNHSSKDPNYNELKAMLYEMQGLIVIKSKEDEAQKLFDKALTSSKDLSMCSRIKFHLAEVEHMKQNGNKTDAIEKYKAVLNETGDIILQLECYDRLGRITFGQGNFSEAHSYYEMQSQLAAKCNQLVFLKRARRGLSLVLSQQNPPNYPEAYLNASKAVSLEQYLKGSDLPDLQRKAVELADQILGIKTPPY
jgi:tetratricopeptide (TPR) repeat protein